MTCVMGQIRVKGRVIFSKEIRGHSLSKPISDSSPLPIHIQRSNAMLVPLRVIKDDQQLLQFHQRAWRF